MRHTQGTRTLGIVEGGVRHVTENGGIKCKSIIWNVSGTRPHIPHPKNIWLTAKGKLDTNKIRQTILALGKTQF